MSFLLFNLSSLLKENVDFFPMAGWILIPYLSPRSSETLSFLRPFALLLASTLRPLAVCILFLNPCTDFLLRLWGWNVRFIS